MKNQIAIICMPDDYYLGDALCRELEKKGYNCLFNLRDASNPFSLNLIKYTKPDILIAIVSKEFVSINTFVEIVKTHTYAPLDCERTYIMKSDDIDVFPKQWEECYLLDVRKGLDLSIVGKVLDFKKCTMTELINPQKIQKSTKKESAVMAQNVTSTATSSTPEISEPENKDIPITNQRQEPIALDTLLSAQMPNSLTLQRAIRYFLGEGVPQDSERGVVLLNKAIEENPADPQTYYIMGLIQESLNEVSTAAEYYQKGSELQHTDSMVRLGVLGLNHNLIEKEDAKKHFEKAHAQGNVESAYGLGLLAEMDGDFSNAVEYYSEAAELGNAMAQNALGCLYAEGKGVTLSEDRAMQWFKLAADQNLIIGMVNYGIRILASANSEQAKKGEELLRIAAKNGNEMAISTVQKIDSELQAKKKRQQEAERRRKKEEENAQALNEIFSAFAEVGSYAKSKLWD